jgi:zinc protease
MKRLAVAVLLWLFSAGVSAAGVKVPDYERVVLPNGATLILMANNEVPLIAFRALLRGGATADPDNRGGTASLLAALLEKGAGARDALQFADAVDRVGGRMQVGAEREYVEIAGSFLARDGKLMVELLSDMLQRPHLDGVEFAKLRDRQIEFIRAAKDSDLAGLVSIYGKAALFTDHPYGRPVGGSEASLARVSLQDVQAFHREQFGADRLIVTVVGDFAPAEMKQLLMRALGKWRPSEERLQNVPAPSPAVRSSRVALIDAPRSTQSYFWLGGPGVARSDARRAALDTVNTAFGGRYMSQLNAELRVRSGLTYGARSGFERHLQPGTWAISSFTRAETTIEAIDLALDVLRRLRTQGIAEADLASARQYIAGQFPLGLETADDWAEVLAMLELYGLDRSYVEGYIAAVQRVDGTAARAVIDSVFPAPDRLQITVIGPAAAIREALAKYGPVTELKLTDAEFAQPLQ